MNDGAEPELTELKELAHLLVQLFETAQRLPNGPGRQAVFEKIDEFRNRLATFIR